MKRLTNRAPSRAPASLGRSPSRRATGLLAASLTGASLLPLAAEGADPPARNAMRGDETGVSVPGRDVGSAAQTAMDFLFEALAASRTIEESTRAPTIVVDGMHSAWDFEGPGSRAGAFETIAATQMEAGDLRGALATARNIEAPGNRDSALIAIAGAKARAGDLEGALATARSVGDVWRRSSTLEDIATWQAGAGDLEGALATAGGIADWGCRARALGRIAGALARSGDAAGAAESITDAVSAARKILHVPDRLRTFARIAGATAEAGDIDEALAMVRDFEGAHIRAYALHTFTPG